MDLLTSDVVLMMRASPVDPATNHPLTCSTDSSVDIYIYKSHTAFQLRKADEVFLFN